MKLHHVAPLGPYDIIIGMNWLNEHKAKVDCLAKTIECLDNRGNIVSIQGIMHEVRPRQISTMQLTICRRKGCEIYTVKIEDLREPLENTYQDDYILESDEIRERLRESFEEKYPYLKHFQDVFPKVLGYLHSKYLISL